MGPGAFENDDAAALLGQLRRSDSAEDAVSIVAKSTDSGC